MALTITLSQLAEVVQPVYERSVEPAEDLHEFEGDNVHHLQGGETPSDILQELLGCEPDLADALQGELDEQNWHVVKDGGQDFYSADQLAYTLAVPYSSKYYDAWATFETEIKHLGRFFNRKQERYLKELFDPLLRGQLNKGVPPFVEAGGERSAIRFVYRAREANDIAARKRIFKNPARELAPPPPRLRRQGRMNAAGVRAFYGCTDIETCVAEIGVPVGGAAIVGKFAFLRRVRLLDFRRVETATPPPRMSWFADDFADEHARVAFMRGLHELIRRPVLPDAEMLEYLPTQVLAEYLASRVVPRLDGVLLASSLTGCLATTILAARRQLSWPVWSGAAV